LPISSKARVAKAQALAYPPVVGSQFGIGKKALGVVNYARMLIRSVAHCLRLGGRLRQRRGRPLAAARNNPFPIEAVLLVIVTIGANHAGTARPTRLRGQAPRLDPSRFATVARKASVLGERDSQTFAQWLEYAQAKPDAKRSRIGF
jgi:hypothetical protein